MYTSPAHVSTGLARCIVLLVLFILALIGA
jgi:hypothetical protein